MVDFVVQVEKPTIAEEVNQALKNSSEGELKGILDYCELPLVSCDHQGTDASSIVDASLTNVVGNNMGKISAWYDNEWGFSNRMCDIAEYLRKIS